MMKNKESCSLGNYRQSYHTVVNRSKKKHQAMKNVEIKVVGPGQLLGSEDAVLNNSNRKINKHTYTAKCSSATCKVLYFCKKKWYDKLSSSGWMDMIIQMARLEKGRLYIEL